MTHFLFFLLGLFVGNLGVLWCLAIIRSGSDEDPKLTDKQVGELLEQWPKCSGDWMCCPCPQCEVQRLKWEQGGAGPYEQGR